MTDMKENEQDFCTAAMTYQANSECTEERTAMRAEITQLRAENERLRKTLEDVLAYIQGGFDSGDVVSPGEVAIYNTLKGAL